MRTARKLSSLIAAIALAATTSTRARADDSTVHERSPKRFGTTFSHHELKARGLDWRAALDACRELGLNFLRLGAYWDELEPVEGYFDFTELDEVIERAGKNGFPVMLTVGMKAPRWPEYYIPTWAKPKTHAGDMQEISRDPKLRPRVLAFIARTVEHCAKHDAIVAWQVDNEPMDRVGQHRNWIGADFVALEAKTIRQNDPRRRMLVINTVSEDQRLASAPWWDGDYDRRNALAIADVVGLDVYPGVDGLPFGLPPKWHSHYRAIDLPKKTLAWAERDHKDAWIVESQAEPWGKFVPKPADVRWLVGQHVEQGFRTVLLWGFEWWYEQKVRHGDASMWNTVKDLATEFLGSACTLPTKITTESRRH